MRIKVFTLVLLLLGIVLGLGLVHPQAHAHSLHRATLPPEIDSSYTQTWGDEFTGTSLDGAKWTEPDMSGSSMDQGSQAWVTPQNTGDNVDHAWVEVNKQSLNGMPYTAGQITSRYTKSFQYGYFEISEQFPSGPGLWGGSWMVNTAGTNCSEIDFPEVLGKDSSTAYFTYHRPDCSQQQFIVHNINWSTGYHRFGMKWTPTAISFYLDDVLIGTATGPITSDLMNLKMNLDVGNASSWAGAPDSTTHFPSYQSVDYVRVYQQSQATPTPTPAPKPVTTAATDYWVAPNGSDANTGTQAAPFATINHADSLIAAGGTIHVAPGVYNEDVSITHGGASGAPVDIVSDTRWGARITSPTARFESVDLHASYVTFDGFEVTNPNNEFGIDMTAGTNVTVIHNLVHDVGTLQSLCCGGGIGETAAAGGALNIDSNWIHHIGHGPTVTGIHGMYISGKGGWVQNNVIYDIPGGWGVNCEPQCSNQYIFGNTIFNVSPKGGIVWGCNTTYGQCTNNRIFDNIIRDVAYGIRTYDFGAGYSSNNLVEYNNVYQATTPYMLQSPVTHSHDITTDPGFVNWQADGSGDYHLTSSSLDVNTGGNPGPDHDYDGVTRPQGSAIDIGAYEYH